MENFQLPKRSKFWFNHSQEEELVGGLIDFTTVIYSIFLAVSSLFFSIPLVSKISFEEAFLTPLVPFIVSFLGVFGIGVHTTISFLIVSGFALSCVGVYLFVKDLTKRQLPSIIASALYLLPPITIFFLIQNNSWVGSNIHGLRSFFLVFYGDSSQMVGLALIPLASIFFLRYLKQNHGINIFLTVFFSSLVFLASRGQALNLIIIFGILSVTEFYLGLTKVKIIRLSKVILLTLGVVSFWYTPVFWYQSISIFYGYVSTNIQNLFPLPFFVGIISIFFAIVFFAKRQERQIIFISTFLLVVFLGITFAWAIYGYEVIPQPYRIISIVNMFGAMVIALSINSFAQKIKLVRDIKLIQIRGIWKAVWATMTGATWMAILFVVSFIISGPIKDQIASNNGILQIIGRSVQEDKFLIIGQANGEFSLITQTSAPWQASISIVLSLVFIGMLIYQGFIKDYLRTV